MKFLKPFIQRFFKSKLIAGSFIMMAGTLIAGVGNYIYHLMMGRILGPVDYGILASLISLIYILGIPLGVLNLVIVKFVSNFKGKEDFASIGIFFRKGTKKILIFTLLFLLVFLVFIPFISSFLHLQSSLLLLLVAAFFFISIFLIINRSFLQGLLKFGYFSSSTILESGLKLITAVSLVILGYRIYGALTGFLIGGMAAWLFTFFPLRFLVGTKKKKLEIKRDEVLRFTLPVFFSILAFTSLFGFDLILVRHFLPGEEAGFYAALSTLGKIIYFLSFPIISVMFPMISERHVVGGHYKNLLLTSLGLVFLVCFFITGFYFLFPSLIVRLLFGEAYLPVAKYLGFFGLFLSFYSLALLLNNFFLSIQKTKLVVFAVAAAIFQIVFICLFHQTIWQVILISLVATASLLAIFLFLLVKYNLRISLKK